MEQLGKENYIFTFKIVVFISTRAQNLTVVGHISVVAVRSPIAGELVNNILADTAIKEILFTNPLKADSKHKKEGLLDGFLKIYFFPKI